MERRTDAELQEGIWHHDHPDEPVLLYSETGDGYESRKVDLFRDGRQDYADESTSIGTTFLGQERNRRSKRSRPMRSSRCS
ncbi:DUF6881 domain-containing protein [Amycolatopsis thermoflava]|uniref:DUF6881 domain-containing protein n=1 Tax=Amycolatopsis thermoflava TaxID=84480 RepID=UPI003657017D